MPDGEPTQRIGANLGDIPAGMTAAGPNDHFAYDPDQLREISRGWDELANSYSESARKSENMARISGPGLDYASEGHAVMANASGKAYITSLRDSATYCRNEAEKYRQALKEMFDIDDQAAKSMTQAGDMDGGI